MTRPPLLVSVIAVLALVWTAPAAVAAVDPQTLPAQTELELPTDNGLQAHLDVFNEEFTLEIERKDETSYASYDVEGEATEAGLKARFGRLGAIDLNFKPTEVELEHPPKGCVGPPSRFSDGVFVGTVSFTGEGNYVRIAATEIEGPIEVWREREWRCPRQSGRTRMRRADRPLPPSPRPEPKAKRKATLAASKPGCRCTFVALSIPAGKGRSQSYFYGAQFEETEGMEILRATGTSEPAGASAFTFNHRAGTASVHPPGPITGSGHFERRRNGPDLWRSTIQVPLLGAEPIDMRAGDYRAVLVNKLPEFR